MDGKKKLVELIRCADYHPCRGAVRTIGSMFTTEFIEDIASHLIANGVTVQEGKDNDVPTKWIPVTERLPETCGYPVLMVAVDKYGQQKIVKGFTNYECPVEFCTNEKEYDLCWHCWEVTHWMPLPKPPKEDS